MRAADPAGSARLRAAARRPGAAGTAAGDRPLRRALPPGAAKPRRRLSAPATPCKAKRRTIPAAAPLQLPPLRLTARGRRDLGVVYAATGAPLTPVASAPSGGQYAVSGGRLSVLRRGRRRGGRRSPTAMCRRTSRRPRSSSRPSAFAPPTASACDPSRSADRRRSPTTQRHLGADPGDAAALPAGRDLMFALGLDGARSADGAARRLTRRASAALAAKAAELAAALADKVRTTSSSGQCSNARRARCAHSIAADVAADGGRRASPSVGSNGDVKYAAIQEYGGKTAAHEILPVKAQALAFIAGGALRFARRVEHPGSADPRAVLSARLARRDERRDRRGARRRARPKLGSAHEPRSRIFRACSPRSPPPIRGASRRGG